MASPAFEALLAQADRVQKMLWIVLTLSIALYTVVAYAAIPEAVEPAMAGTLRPILWVAAAGLAATSLLISRRRRGSPVQGSTFGRDPESPESPLLRGDVHDLPADERRALAQVARGFGAWIVCLVMNEAVAILGLILAFISGEPGEIAPFATLAILLNLMMRPDARRRAASALGHVGL